MDVETLLQTSTIKTRAELADVCQVTRQAVQRWQLVPEDRCHFVEAATFGEVTVEALRPDRQWKRARNGRVIGYTVPVPS